MAEWLKTPVRPECEGQRLDSFLARETGLSRAAVQRLVAEGNVLVNGAAPGKSLRLAAGDQVCLCVPPPKDCGLVPQNIPLDIVYEDEALLVVNKPKGMVVHPAAGNPDETLVNALMHHCGDRLSGIGGELRPGIVHRIDKDTSGLLLVAKTDEAHRALSRQFSAHSISRVYYAVAHGHFKREQGTVDSFIGRHRLDRKKMAMMAREAPGARHAVTHYQVLSQGGGYSLLALRLETGRTHQIRVHMAALGHPLAGDTVYGPKKAPKGLQGQCLHAKTLGFVHPLTGEYMEFDSELPEYFRQFLAATGMDA